MITAQKRQAPKVPPTSFDVGEESGALSSIVQRKEGRPAARLCTVLNFC
jgi:hypothetical protein